MSENTDKKIQRATRLPTKTCHQNAFEYTVNYEPKNLCIFPSEDIGGDDCRDAEFLYRLAPHILPAKERQRQQDVKNALIKRRARKKLNVP